MFHVENVLGVRRIQNLTTYEARTGVLIIYGAKYYAKNNSLVKLLPGLVS